MEWTLTIIGGYILYIARGWAMAEEMIGFARKQAKKGNGIYQGLVESEAWVKQVRIQYILFWLPIVCKVKWEKRMSMK